MKISRIFKNLREISENPSTLKKIKLMEEFLESLDSIEFETLIPFLSIDMDIDFPNFGVSEKSFLKALEGVEFLGEEVDFIEYRDLLLYISRLSGKGSQTERILKIREFFSRINYRDAIDLYKLSIKRLSFGVKTRNLLKAIANRFGIDGEIIEDSYYWGASLLEIIQDLNSGNSPRSTPLPGKPFSPMLPENKVLNEQGGYFYQDKLDGLRAMLHYDGARFQIFGRSKKPLTNEFPEIIGEYYVNIKEGIPPFIIDGEIVSVVDGEIVDFKSVQSRTNLKNQETGNAKIYLFDCVYYSQPINHLPIEERIKYLKKIPGGTILNTYVNISETLFSKGDEKAEGAIAKKINTPYLAAKRGGGWIKIKREDMDLDLILMGITPGRGKRGELFGAIITGTWEGDKLTQVAKVGTGLKEVDMEQIYSIVLDLEIPPPEWMVFESDTEIYKVVDPKIIVKVSFFEITVDQRGRHSLRFPKFMGIREDKTPEEVDTYEKIQILSNKLIRE